MDMIKNLVKLLFAIYLFLLWISTSIACLEIAKLFKFEGKTEKSLKKGIDKGSEV